MADTVQHLDVAVGSTDQYLGAAIAITLLVANLVIMLAYNRIIETRARRALG